MNGLLLINFQLNKTVVYFCNVVMMFHLEAFASEKPKDLTQQFLLAIGEKQNRNEFHLVLDRQVLPLGGNPIVALSRLHYSFWVFNVSYFPRLNSFYNFF